MAADRLMADVPIRVDLLCNDHRNGCFLERLEGLHAGPNLALVSRRIDWGPRLRYLCDDRSLRKISVAGRHFPVVGYQYGVGNWCWDAVTMRGKYVVDLLNFLRRKGWFEVDEAEERLFNSWQSGHVFTDDDIRLLAKNFDR